MKLVNKFSRIYLFLRIKKKCNYISGEEVKNKVMQFTEITSDSRPDDSSVKLHSGLYYHCNDVWNPEIGDLRLQFSFAGLEGTPVKIKKSFYQIIFNYIFGYFILQYTVVGQLKNGKIVPYQTSVNVNVLLVYEGEHTLSAAFKAAHYNYKLTTWCFRFAGWLLLFFAITATSNLLHFVCKL